MGILLQPSGGRLCHDTEGLNLKNVRTYIYFIIQNGLM